MVIDLWVYNNQAQCKVMHVLCLQMLVAPLLQLEHQTRLFTIFRCHA